MSDTDRVKEALITKIRIEKTFFQDANKVVFMERKKDGKTFSYIQILEEIEKGSEIGENFVQNIVQLTISMLNSKPLSV